MRRQIPAAV
uniref:Uncharacterized protein n=1 Tax=Arundo donax TaxID=35708 RepID=A0A0A8ZYP7_ARUDO